MPQFPLSIDTDPDSPDFGRLRPVLSSEQVRALALGRELNMWNTVRANRAVLMLANGWDESPPAFHAAFLVGLAQIDELRRNLRVLLREALDNIGRREVTQ